MIGRLDESVTVLVDAVVDNATQHLDLGRAAIQVHEGKALIIVCLEEKIMNDGQTYKVMYGLDCGLQLPPYPAFQIWLGR